MEVFTLTVSQLNRYIGSKLKGDENLHRILVRGEISNFTNHIKTGHLYFTLKDGQSSVKAVMFRSYAAGLRFMPESGMSVIVSGDVEVFERDGVYQIYVNDIIPDGEGALNLAFEQLKQKLSVEGLFDESHKKSLPEYPNKICIITAKTGAAIQDILNILGRRYPLANVLLIPTLVQGEGAPKSLCDSMKLAEKSDSDVIIIGRGGGSSEDLSAFNDENLARLIYNSEIPVISAVGHEVDFTIADFVADLRAPTPSAAAELAVPDCEDLKKNIILKQNIVSHFAQRNFANFSSSLFAVNSRLTACSPANKLNINFERLSFLNGKVQALAKNSVEKKLSELNKLNDVMAALNPLNVLQRGYSVIYRDGRIIKSAKALKSGDIIKIKFCDTEIEATIN